MADPRNRYISIPVQDGNTSGGYRFPIDEPELAAGYVAATEPDHLGLGDVDLFTADLDVLRLDYRTRRSLEEALTAYRQGLFLSTASLLGAVSEGAWYAAGEQLRDRNWSASRWGHGEWLTGRRGDHYPAAPTTGVV